MRRRIERAVASIGRGWATARTRDRAIGSVAAIVGCTLLGAFLFGAWHVLVGGFVRGNWRAGEFGLALAAVTGLLLALETVLVRRRLRA